MWARFWIRGKGVAENAAQTIATHAADFVITNGATTHGQHELDRLATIRDGGFTSHGDHGSKRRLIVVDHLAMNALLKQQAGRSIR